MLTVLQPRAAEAGTVDCCASWMRAVMVPASHSLTQCQCPSSYPLQDCGTV